MFGDSTSSEEEILQLKSRPSSVLWLEKPYITSELLQILKFIEGLDFNKINLTENLSDDVPNQLLIKVLMLNNRRASFSMDPKNFPTLLGKLITQGFKKWDYFKLEDCLAKDLWHDFQNQLLALFKTRLTLPIAIKTEEHSQEFHDYLLQESYKAPAFANAVEFLLINFIASLTNLKLSEQAKIIHDFIHFCKMVVKDDLVKKQAYLPLFVSSLIEGLNITNANPELLAFVRCIFNEALSHPIFSLPYDEHIYTILYQQNGIPNLIYRDLSTPLTDIQSKHYQDVCHNLDGQSVLNYFVQMVTLTCTFHDQELAKEMHDTLYRLRQLYRTQEATPDKNANFGKALRMLFCLPSYISVLDKRFDEIAVNVLFENQELQLFNKPFKLTKYIKSADQGIYNRYCMELQERLNGAQGKIIVQAKTIEDQTQQAVSQKELIDKQIETITTLTTKLVQITKKYEKLEEKLDKQDHEFADLEGKLQELTVKEEGKNRVLTFLHNHAPSSPPFIRQRSLSDSRLKAKPKQK